MPKVIEDRDAAMGEKVRPYVHHGMVLTQKNDEAVGDCPFCGRDNKFTVNAAKAIGAGVGFGLAAGLAGIGQGLVGSRAAEGAARNPGAASTVQTLMIIALALIESLVLFALLIAFVVIKPVTDQ